jgi:hypothetical protein
MQDEGSCAPDGFKGCRLLALLGLGRGLQQRLRAAQQAPRYHRPHYLHSKTGSDLASDALSLTVTF